MSSSFLIAVQQRSQHLTIKSDECSSRGSAAPDLPIELQHRILDLALGSVVRTLCHTLCGLHDALVENLTFSIASKAAFLDPVSIPLKKGLLNPVEAFRSRISRCPSLTCVSLTGCDRVDDNLIEWMITERVHLRRIDLSFCPALTTQTLRLLEAKSASSALWWRVEGCVFEPSPALSAEQVLRNQLYALRMNNDAGLAKCFCFASPSNKQVTGPLPRFSRMIREGYSVMLRWREAYIAEHPIMNMPGWNSGHAIYLVTLLEDSSTDVRAECTSAAAFNWCLEVQGAECGFEGCWMTSSVGSAQLRQVQEPDGTLRGRRVEQPPWGEPVWRAHAVDCRPWDRRG
jgi:hypothetical protein